MPAFVTRTLAQVLAGSDAGPLHARAFFYDEPRLRETARAQDRTLYAAERDVYDPRVVATVDGTWLRWRLDRVDYSGEDLPTGELNRSVGHWNAPDQWEIFEVERGEVAMVVAAGPARPVDLVRCGPGDIVGLRPGSWHLTYVLHGPAVVTNAYSAPAPGPAYRPASDPAKYFVQPTVRVGLRRSGGDVAVFADSLRAASAWRRARSGTDMLDGLDSLAAVLSAENGHGLLTDPAGHIGGLLPAS